MAGNPDNAQVWERADVYIGGLDAVIPEAGAEFGVDWDAVGLLNGDDGFTETVAVEAEDHFAWGGILVATSRSNFKLSRTFIAYEDNETVFDLLWPGHEVVFDGANGFEGDVNVPNLQHRFKIAFQTRTGQGEDAVIKRVISRNYAQVGERGDSQESETTLASREVTVDIYPDAADAEGVSKLFYTYRGPLVASS